MKYLITGGAGFIGSTIANKLGDDCIVIDNLSTGNLKNLDYKTSLIKGNILDEKFIDQIFAKYKPVRVIHLAAQVSVAKSIGNPTKDADTNIKGTINILNACVKYKIQKIILASSAAVYGNTRKLPIKETAQTNPLSPYGISKLATEFYANYFYKQFGLAFTALRFANVYGPKQDSSGEGGVIAIFTGNAKNKKTLNVFGDGEQTRDFIYVDDVANASIKAVNSQKTGIFNVSTNTENSINKIIGILQKKRYLTSEVIRAAKRPGDIERSRLDNSKIKKEFNWSAQYDLEAGLEKMFIL